MNKPVPIPLVPDRSAGRDAHVRSLVRAAIATGIAALEKPTRATEYVKATWNDDHLAGMVLRAAVQPATLAGSAALAHVSVAFLETLAPISAGADLLKNRCDQIRRTSQPSSWWKSFGT